MELLLGAIGRKSNHISHKLKAGVSLLCFTKNNKEISGSSSLRMIGRNKTPAFAGVQSQEALLPVRFKCLASLPHEGEVIMKRLSLIVVCFLALTKLSAQIVPLYGEVYDEVNNRLLSKQWVSSDGHYRQEVIENGITSIIIYRADTNKFYRLDTQNKTYLVIPMEQLQNANGMLGMKVQESANTTTEFIGNEEVEGKMCDHYRYTTVTTLTNGRTQTTIYDQWLYPPYNTWVRQTVGQFGSDRQILRNVTTGAQPNHLFELPSDYRELSIPGGLFNIFSN